jgi:hypothetical protein
MFAFRVALMITSRNMPPPPDALDDETRSRMVSELCRSAKDAALCVRSIDPKAEAPYIMNSSEILRAIDRDRSSDEARKSSALKSPDATSPKPSPGEAMLEQHDDAVSFWGALAPMLDPTYLAAVTLIADERCSKEVGDAYTKCVTRILDQKRYFLPAAPSVDPRIPAGK